MSKFIFVTGGVLSGLGKGITCASIGALLESMGHKISFLKLDPYLNVDPGTMSPYQHGEVFVTQDGAETDLDLGHYERFTNIELTKDNSITAGKLYAKLIDKERAGEFLGKTIQTIPHFTDEIKNSIYKISDKDTISIIEIGGTIGDIESLPFIEAIRQINLEVGKNNCLYIHLTYVPFIETSGELKTKPTQHSVKELKLSGVHPDILICRSKFDLHEDIKQKISLFTNVCPKSIISAADLKNVYQMPIYFASQNLPKILSEKLNLTYLQPNLEKWQNICETLANLKDQINIAIVGKYAELKDAYKSLYEALAHAQIPIKTKINIQWINAQELNKENLDSNLSSAHGILIPGGFGIRGIEGKILAVQFARENKIPFFGICLGMQMAVIEFARNILKLSNANSTEFDSSTNYPVVDMLEEQKTIKFKGATMRLGKQDCNIDKASRAYSIYNNNQIQERHRHRYEFNPEYTDLYAKSGMLISGINQEQNLPEIIEISDHPFFVACQFHPEFKSKPFNAHPLFTAFVKAAKESANL